MSRGPCRLARASLVLALGMAMGLGVVAAADAPAAGAVPPPRVIGPNLVANGDFSQADPADAQRPAQWGRPDGLGVQWAAVPSDLDPAVHGKAIRMDTAISEQAMMAHWAEVGIHEWNIPHPTTDPVAGAYGLSLYSSAFPIQANRYYRVSVAFHGAGAKIWVRGYGPPGQGADHPPHRIYEAVTELTPSPKGWAVTTYDFNPTRHTPKVVTMKIMLFAYWPPGVTWFDDVQVRELAGVPESPPVPDDK